MHTSTRAYPGRRWLGLALSSGDQLTGVPDGNTGELVTAFVTVSQPVPHGATRHAHRQRHPPA